MYDTELNDLKKLLRKCEVSVEKKNQFIKSLKTGKAWHTLSAKLLYQ